jgi:hypothetical protein
MDKTVLRIATPVFHHSVMKFRVMNSFEVLKTLISVFNPRGYLGSRMPQLNGVII